MQELRPTSAERPKRGEKAHDVHFHTVAWEAELQNTGERGLWKRVGGRRHCRSAKKCIGLSPNYPYLTLLDKRLSGMLVASGATVVVAISIVHNGRRFASSFGFGSTLGAAVNVNPAFVDTRTAVAYAYKQLGIS